MINNILKDEEYKHLILKQSKETIELLMAKNVEFAVTANLKGLHFEPDLPKSIKSKLANFSLFVLSNYTYTTISLSDTTMTFEAGFGAENFATIVSVPYISIFQIVIDESIIFINTLATMDDLQEQNNFHDKSMNVFKNNPSNKDLLD
ncbi:MAG: hypothetical protein HRT41_08100 [Campylobacteraceae bacterium]|nr:hypothetical protein [Campylobacteraceae bacterium]